MFLERASKLLETLDEKTSAKISETRSASAPTKSSDVSALLGGGLLSASPSVQGLPTSLPEACGSTSLALSTPARSSTASLTPTPATVMPGAHADQVDEAGAATVPAQRKEQMALLAADLQVVLQHGHALHARLQKEGMGRQALALRVRELERAGEEAAERAAAREAALRAEVEALQAREAKAREQVGRENDERRQRDEELKGVEERVSEQAALAAAAAAESAQLRQRLSAQAAASDALRDELDASQRELAALRAAKLERERQLEARESSLEARAAELTAALSSAARAAEAKAADAERAAAALDVARAELARERQAREAAEAASARAAAELEELGARLAASSGRDAPAADSAGGGDAGSASAAALEAAHAQLERSEARARALASELEALRADAAEAARLRAAGASAEQLLLRTVGGAGADAAGSERAQLEELSHKLAEQHELVTQLRSDRAALKLELEAEAKRRRLAEQLSARKGAPSVDDVEEGGGEGFSPAARMQLKRRWAHRPNVAKVMEVVDEAAQLIDRGSLQTTRFLSHNPYVRLVVACYVLVLHLWVLVVLMHLAPGSRAHVPRHAHVHAGLPPSSMQPAPGAAR